jgi:hypothetical protein
MKILSLALFSIISFATSAEDTERHKWNVGLNQNGCSISLESRVIENDTIPNDYQTTVGLNYYFFKKRPSVEHIELDFYGNNQDNLLHIVQVLPSLNSDEHKIQVESLKVFLGDEVIHFEKSYKFDPTFPRFSLHVESVEKVWQQIMHNKEVEYVFTYSNKSELKHSPMRKDIKTYSEMFQTCVKKAV